MIRPLTNVNISVHGETKAVTDGDKNGGKVAYGQLLRKEDVSTTDESQSLLIPYHAVDYATAERSSETVADPVDDLCKAEEGGIAGKCFQFHDTITLPPVGTEWDVSGNIHVMGTVLPITGIKADTYEGGVEGLAFRLQAGDDSAWETLYSLGWLAGVPSVCFDSDAPEGFEEWLTANADETEGSLETCYKLNATINVNTAMTVSVTGSLMVNGAPRPIYQLDIVNGDTNQLTVEPIGGETLVLYDSASGWTVSEPPTLCLSAFDPAYFMEWLAYNATVEN